MRFELQIILKKKELPIEYRKAVLSLIKTALTHANNGIYFKDYFNGTNSKDYTFSVKLCNPTFEKNSIKLDGNQMTIMFSTNNKKSGYILFTAFSEQIGKKFPLVNENFMTINKIKVIKEKETKETEVLIKFLSPLVVREHNRVENKDWYYAIGDDEFKTKLIDIMKKQLLISGIGENFIDGIEVELINMKKVVVKHYGCNIQCSLGFLEIKGSSAIINYFIKSGIGSRRSAGFGMARLISD